MKSSEIFEQGLALALYNCEEDWFTFKFKEEVIDVRGYKARYLKTSVIEGMRVAKIEDVRRAVEA